MVMRILVHYIFASTCPHTAMTLSSILIKSMVSRTSEEHKTNRQKWTSSLVLRRILYWCLGWIWLWSSWIRSIFSKVGFFLGRVFLRRTLIADCREAWVRLFIKLAAIPLFAWHFKSIECSARYKKQHCLHHLPSSCSLGQGFLNVLFFKAVSSEQNIWEAS